MRSNSYSNVGRQLSTVAALLVSNIVVTSPVFAQTDLGSTSSSPEVVAADVAAGDIVVTAQRRSERLQNVGISVAAFSGEALQAQGLTNTTDVAKLTPGVTLSGTFGGQSIQFSVRGVTQSDFNDAIESPVAVYVDDVYVASQQGQSAALFDIERVEALKGPQGTLFGRNATGGLVHFIPTKPQIGRTEGYLQGTFARFNTTTLEGAINLPLGDKAALRVSGIWNRNDAIWKNVFPRGLAAGAPINFGPVGLNPAGEDLGNQDTRSGRVQLTFEPSSDLSIRLAGSATRQKLSTSPWASFASLPVVDAQNRTVQSVFASPTETRAAIGPHGENFFDPAVFGLQGFLYSPTTPGRRAPGANYFGYVPVDIEKRELSSDFAQSDRNRFETYSGALHVDWKLGEIDLISVTAYARYKKDFMLDIEASPVNVFDFGSIADTETISQEVRIGQQSTGFSWVAGLYYLDIDARNVVGIVGPRGSAYSTLFGAVATGIDTPSVFRLRTYSGSIFGQVSYEFVPRLTAVLGGRVIRERQTYDYQTLISANTNDYTLDSGPGPATYPAFNDRRAKTLWAGKAQLEFRPDNRLLLYAGVNRGVKGGSYNGQYFDGGPPIAANKIPYGSETLVSTEAGFKLTGPANAYTLNAAVFYYDYKDYQSFNFVNLVGTVTNVDARTFGAEVAATVRIGRGLRASASGAYLDARVKNFAVAPGVLRNTRPAYTPEFAGSARLDYTLPSRPLDGELTFGAGLTYSSSFFHNARNFDSSRLRARTVVDMNADWSFANGFSVGGFVKNLFDARYATVGLDLTTACGCTLQGYGQPVTWGIKAGYKF